VDERTNSFGYWLRRRRKALDLTQEALAQSVASSRFAIRKIDAARALRPVERMEVDKAPVTSKPTDASFLLGKL
jgi:transcriptional regulator with XRE-family HTH domain